MTNEWKFPEFTVKCLVVQRLQNAIAQASVPENALKLTKDSILHPQGGQDAQPLHPTIKFPVCGTGILPVHENSATSQFQFTKNNCHHEIPLNRAKNSTRVLYVSAIALKLANNWQQTPQAIAAQLVESLKLLCSGDFTVEVAPSGIVQFELTDVALAVWLQRLAQTSLPLPQSLILPVVSADRVFPLQYSHARCCSLLRMAHRDRIISIVEFDATTTPQIWSLSAPNPIPWLDDEKLRLVHPAEYNLISQLLTVLDSLAFVFGEYSDEKPIDYFKLANSLSEAFQTFYSQCRIWGEVKIETPKLAQARLGLVLATQSLLRFMLEELLNAVAPLEL
jgi:arginyl-tRNA synthetase